MPSNGNGNGGTPINGDILGALTDDVSIIRGDTTAIKDNTQLLTEISDDLSEILKCAHGWSQQDARSRIYDTTNRNDRSSDRSRGRSGFSGGSSSSRRNTGDPEEFIDGFFEQLQQNLLGQNFKSAMQQNMKEFANAMGLELQDLPSAFGKSLANQLSQTKIGKDISEKLHGTVDKIFDNTMKNMRSGVNKFYGRATNNGSMSGEQASEQQAAWDSLFNQMSERFANRDAAGAINDLVGAAQSGSLSLEAGFAGIVEAALPFVGALAAGAAILWVADKALDALANATKPLTESFDNLKGVLHKTANRYFESERQNIKKQTERLTADINTMITKPFEIMEAAAEDWYNAWDSNLKTINATQGYTKADLQDLMSSYAERLRSENLQSAISAADISTNLAKVLDSGLSGQVAEEFAYLATILQNAVPTQDFFSYASTYASIAANQIAAGKSQAAAIEAANKQLTQFASSLLYANRELSGGFSTGLTNASSILESAVQIANTAGIRDSSYISATLAGISSVVGAIAPDLASGLTDAIVQAALGGNSDSLTALRSLANTGASNTAFLNAFARDPQGVLTTLFTNLSNMQNLNKVNFMEVAESLADTFGLSIGALTRVDFASLAQAVSNIDVTMNSLDANLKLLQEGQTTTTAEQLKMTQINEMILNQGLSYVLDNQAARAIQQHMWDQELAAQMQEATYGVELQGAALEFLSGIFETVNNILNFLNPFSFLGKIFKILDAQDEANALKFDIKRVLEAGRVGTGNSKSIYNLTTYDVDKLTNTPQDLASMMTGYSKFASTRAASNRRDMLMGPLFGTSSWAENLGRYLDAYDKAFSGAINSLIGGPSSGDRSSQYNFVTKGLYNSLSNTSFTRGGSNDDTITSVSAASTTSVQSQINQQSASNLQSFLDSMQDAVESNQSYAEWVRTSQSYGISNLESALEEYSITLQEVQGKFQEYQAAQSTEYSYNKEQKEMELWDRLLEFMNTDMAQLFETVTANQEIQISLLENVNSTLTAFLESWKYEWLVGAWNRDWIQDAWRSQWLDQAWRSEWIDQAWNQNWIQDAWQNSWLNQAWGEQWLNNAWKHDWIETAWNQNWIQDAWNNGLLEIIRKEWIEKAWNRDWLDNAWGRDWITNAWNQNWIQDAWGQQWLNQAWNKSWLDKAWGREWIDRAWNASWLQQSWTEDWLDNAWRQDWIEKAWSKDWIQDAWRQEWIKEAFGEQFVEQCIKLLWGNRWIEFFNIFKDRFGGISTNFETGETAVDLEGLYRIYTKETGEAAKNALKEVEETDTTGDAILALTKQLTQNNVDLRDPQVQTNVLLSQILIVLEAIMQAENTSGGASLATTLASLGMGLTTPNTSGMTAL